MWMKYPGAVANATYDSVAYSYDATTGLLRAVRDPYNHRFAYGYDSALRMVTDSSLTDQVNPAVNTRTYDDESRITAQTMVKAATQLGTHTIAYTEASKVRSATFTVAGLTGAPAMHYARLGPLTNSADNNAFFNDSVVSDPLGNARTKMHVGSTIDITTSFYEAGSAMLSKTSTVKVNSGHPWDSTTYLYRAGSIWKTTVYKFAHVGWQGISAQDTLYARTTATSSYAADNKLMLTVTHFDTLDASQHMVYGPSTYDETEEYRYDALGRRIWRRLERPDALCPIMDKASGCLSVVERTVWDGDQVLAEIRADGGLQSTSTAMECDGGCALSRPALEGRVLYTTGAGLDHPLDVIRLDWYNDVIVPVYSWRGRAVDGICVNGSQFCTDFTWPARTESATFEDPPVTDPVYGGPIAWAGNIMDTQKDGSGLVYKRNRYYDPASGRFTQVDPIGLGGGLNAYSFGGGDQVSYIDPFGTCPPQDKNQADCQKDGNGNQKKAYCPSGSEGTPPNCKSVASGKPVAGSCPNVSPQEWQLGQEAIQATQTEGKNLENGSYITTDGSAFPMTGPDFARTGGPPPTIGPVGAWPAGTVTMVHSHVGGGGISEGDIAATDGDGVRTVSAGVGTNRYGAYSKGGTPTTCNVPEKPTKP
jgi:RHS repeat-associated protein